MYNEWLYYVYTTLASQEGWKYTTIFAFFSYWHPLLFLKYCFIIHFFHKCTLFLVKYHSLSVAFLIYVIHSPLSVSLSISFFIHTSSTTYPQYIISTYILRSTIQNIQSYKYPFPHSKILINSNHPGLGSVIIPNKTTAGVIP